MPTLFPSVAATPAETLATRPGDDLVSPADVVMDRAFTLDAAPEVVWPWLLQLGKQRAGWYLPRTVERLLPRSRRALRHLEPRWLDLAEGERIPDYGGPKEYFEAVAIEPARYLVYRSERGRTSLSWAITLTPRDDGTRVHLRLRLAPVRRRWLANSVGDAFDALTIAGMAAGLRERLAGARA